MLYSSVVEVSERGQGAIKAAAASNELLHRDETALVRQRHDRIAAIYDLMESWMELRARKWRAELWARVPPGRVLELGAGTGKNLPYYPRNAEITAIDISPRMLERAHRRARHLAVAVDLRVADAQELPFPDESFDTIVTTFVFCSIPDPARALAEARRVLRPGGQLLMLEHVLSQRPILRWLMRKLDFVPSRLWGAHINRETVASVAAAGCVEIRRFDLSLDVVTRIEAWRGPFSRSEAAGESRS